MFTYIDAIILILIAICVFAGAWRGFFRSITKFCGLSVKLLISFFLCKPIAKLISNITQIDEHMFDKYSKWASGLGGNFNVNLRAIPSESLNDFVKNSLADTGVPKIFRGLLTSALDISPESISNIESVTLAELVGESLKNLILVSATFMVIFALLFLIILVINKIEKRILRSTKIVSKIDRALGGFVGLFKSFLIIFGICLFLSVFRNVIIFKDFYTTIDSSFISGPISRAMFKLIDNKINFNQMIIEWISTKM